MKEIRKTEYRLKQLLTPQKAEKGIEYVPSQFALPFTHGDRQYVFHTLTKQCVEEALPSFCEAGEGYDELIANYFLVPRGKDENAFYQSILGLMRLFHQEEKKCGFTVLPTFACNARCVYCYQEGTAPVSMTPEIEEQTVRYLLENRDPDRPLYIKWYGGEPLLGEKTIDRISQALCDAGVDYRCNMISNGSLITPAIVEKMTSLWHLESIQLSMDGAEEDYRRRKCYPPGHDEYHDVLHAISLLQDAGIRVSVRCNVDEGNWSRIPQFLEDLRTFVPGWKKVPFYFAPLFEVRGKEGVLDMWEKIISQHPSIRAEGFKTFLEGGGRFDYRFYRCVGDGGSLIITPDGNLYCCEHFPEGAKVGDIWNGITEPKTWGCFCHADGVPDECMGCAFLPICIPLAVCPLINRDCREVNRRILLADLRFELDAALQEETSGEETASAC